MAAQPVPVPSSHASVTLCATLYVPAAGVAVVVGAAVSTTKDWVWTVSALPDLSTEKNFSGVFWLSATGAE